jgi:hypothetical protein
MLARLADELPAGQVLYDQLDAGRLRHPARFLRWRPDRDPRSCGFDQLPIAPGPYPASSAESAGSTVLKRKR